MSGQTFHDLIRGDAAKLEVNSPVNASFALANIFSESSGAGPAADARAVRVSKGFGWQQARAPLTWTRASVSGEFAAEDQRSLNGEERVPCAAPREVVTSRRKAFSA